MQRRSRKTRGIDKPSLSLGPGPERDGRLTTAVRPSPRAGVELRQGYRIGAYHDGKTGAEIPMVSVALTEPTIMDVFLALLDPLDCVVDVLLESRHQDTGDGRQDFLREAIDIPVLKSYCCDFEELLLNDGFLSLCVLDLQAEREVQLDDHKTLIVFANDLNPFVGVLDSFGIRRDDSLQLVSETEHIHSTRPSFADRLESFCMRLSAEQRRAAA